MDYNGISRKAYRELATVQVDLLREHFVSEAKKQLDQKMTSFAPIKVISKNFKTTESEALACGDAQHEGSSSCGYEKHHSRTNRHFAAQGSIFFFFFFFFFFLS